MEFFEQVTEFVGDLFHKEPNFEKMENFVPGEYTQDDTHAEEAMEWFEMDRSGGRSGLFSQMSVIGEFTDHHLVADEVVEYARQNGFYSEETGLSQEGMTAILELFGTDYQEGFDKSFDDLKYCLDNGGRAIVEVDGGEIWNGEGFFSDLFHPHAADHTLEVIGYDAVHDAVIVNDSANPNGAGELIPKDVFMDAWKDSDNHMIECYRTDSKWFGDYIPNAADALVDWDRYSKEHNQFYDVLNG